LHLYYKFDYTDIYEGGDLKMNDNFKNGSGKIFVSGDSRNSKVIRLFRQEGVLTPQFSQSARIVGQQTMGSPGSHCKIIRFEDIAANSRRFSPA
jgi:hypothetical protein